MTQKGLVPILIVLILAALVGGYLVYQKQAKPTSYTQPTIQPSPTADPTANWKTYKDSEIGYMLEYPNNWSIKTHPIRYEESSFSSKPVPTTGIQLDEKNGTASIQIYLNFQGGFCEGGGCKQEDYKTTSGLIGKKDIAYIGKDINTAYYSFYLGPSVGSLLIMTDAKSQTEIVHKIIDSISTIK